MKARRVRLLRCPGVLAALAFALAACGAASGPASQGSSAVRQSATPATSAPPVFLRGTVELRDGSGTPTPRNFVQYDDSTCSGVGGFADLTLGAAVTVYDQTSVVIASSSVDSATRDSISGDHTCALRFRASVPTTPTFYQVEVSHRGKVVVQPTNLQGVTLTIGNSN